MRLYRRSPGQDAFGSRPDARNPDRKSFNRRAGRTYSSDWRIGSGSPWNSRRIKTTWSNDRRHSTASPDGPINPVMRRGGNVGWAGDAVDRQIKIYRTAQRRNAVSAGSRDGVRFTHSQRFRFRFFRSTPPRYGRVGLSSNLVFAIEFGSSLIDITRHFYLRSSFYEPRQLLYPPLRSKRYRDGERICWLLSLLNVPAALQS